MQNPGSFFHHWLRHVFARKRYIYACIFAATCFVITPNHWGLATRSLIAWNSGSLLYIYLVVNLMRLSTEASIKKRAEEIDESRFIFLAFSISASIAALAAIIGQLNTAREVEGFLRVAHLMLAVLTNISVWTFLHFVFAQHYAHEFFIERECELELNPEDRGGLRFPGGQRPVYSDFVYFAFVIGVACQTADVSLTSRPMRRLCLAHCMLAFFFNATILAITINITASLLSAS
jgi:uncharacterized membrane protein